MSVQWKSLDAIAGRIHKNLKGGLTVDDTRISLKLIKDEIHISRAAVLKSLVANNAILNINNQFYQKICCLKVKCENIICDGIKGPDRETITIPSTIGALGEKSIRFLGSVDHSVVFEQKKSIDSGKSVSFPFINNSKPSPYFIVENNTTAVLKNNPVIGLEYVCIEGIFDNPENALLISDCAEPGDYPIPGDYLDDVERRVINKLTSMLRIMPDVKDDALSN